ncbi:Uncharacterised protein [Candidatus Tiddalikarchaeum anstoanum]|nr:Uncharacterised protein [Candidatus Tiddalikarchaeum anstoanum]
MISYNLLLTEFGNVIDETYKQVTNRNPLITPFVGGVFKRVNMQLMLSVKAGSMQPDYNLNFSFPEYMSKINGVKTFRNKMDLPNRTINDVNDCFRYYCGLDDMLWETKENKEGGEVFNHVRGIFNDQVRLSKLILCADGDMFSEVIINEFKDYGNAVKKISVITAKRFELYDYLKKNKLMNGLNSLILDNFIDATKIIEGKLKNIIYKIFENSENIVETI